MTDVRLLTGGEAVAHAMRQIDPDVVPVYPITPQTPIIQTFAKLVADGAAQTEIVNVESEHSGVELARGRKVVDREPAERVRRGQRSASIRRSRPVARMKLDDLHVVAVGIDGRGEQTGLALLELREPRLHRAARDLEPARDLQQADARVLA